MSGRSQEPDSLQSKQKTPEGLEIPVPKRRDLIDAFRKIVGPVKPKKS